MEAAGFVLGELVGIMFIEELKKGANFLICCNLGFFLIMAFYFELFRNRWEEFGEFAGLLKRKIKGISFCWNIAGARF